MMPSECEHGRIFDWGDFGGEDSQPEDCLDCSKAPTSVWCEEHRHSPHPRDPDQETCAIWSWEMEYRPVPVPCRMVDVLIVRLDAEDTE
jgi:hypothetical protein